MNDRPGLMTRLPIPPDRHLAYDGRQFTSFAEGPTVPMNLHRYLFAAALTPGRTVLDLGCGEGYGAAILAETSRCVVALDRDDHNLRHARRAYRRGNLDFVRGDVFAPPADLPAADVVVAFEVIDTLEAAHALLAGLALAHPRPATVMLSLPSDLEPGVGELKAHAWEIAAVFRQSFEVGSVMRRVGGGGGSSGSEVRIARRGAHDLGCETDAHFAGAPDRTIVVLHEGAGAPALSARYDFNDASVIARLEERIEAAEQALAASAPSGFADGTERPQPLVFHVHIYKNAGTSVDRLLAQRFGAAWGSFETMSDDRQEIVGEFHRWLSAQPHLEAVSSHTCPMLGADFGSHLLLPIVFLRDPLERIFSSYRFERREARDEFRHRLAKSSDFEGYFKGMLEGPQAGYVRNFQAARLASLLGPVDPRPLRTRALAALDALPFVGLVPRFLDSIEAYARLFATAGVDLPVAEAFDNRAQDFPDGLEDARPGELLSRDTLRDLVSQNAVDVELFERVCAQPAFRARFDGARPGVRRAGRAEPAQGSAESPEPRPLLLHCHCFKNAGTTFDNSVKRSLGAERLIEMDKHPDYRASKPYNAELIARIAAEQPGAYCLSSHQTVPTTWISDDIALITVAFVRHPLLRAASVYRFEHKRGSPRAVEAGSFRAWLKVTLNALDSPEAKNYQAALFSIEQRGRPILDLSVRNRAVHLDRVLDRLDSMAAVGVVEEFERSTRLFHDVIRPFFANFTLSGADNRTKAVSDWREEARALEESLPMSLMERFHAMNEQDYRLFERYLARLPA